MKSLYLILAVFLGISTALIDERRLEAREQVTNCLANMNSITIASQDYSTVGGQLYYTVDWSAEFNCTLGMDSFCSICWTTTVYNAPSSNGLWSQSQTLTTQSDTGYCGADYRQSVVSTYGSLAPNTYYRMSIMAAPCVITIVNGQPTAVCDGNIDDYTVASPIYFNGIIPAPGGGS